MDYIFLTGLLGSLVLVTGAAWAEPLKNTHPMKSVKNWLFGVGAVIMLLYSVLGYLNGGPIFFALLESLVVIASVLMMMNIDDRISAAIIGISGALFIVWSLSLFSGYNTVVFILGLTSIGLGYAFKMGTHRRNLALTLGSLIIATFSFLESSWVFFWLNVFFAIFLRYYFVKDYLSPKKTKHQKTSNKGRSRINHQ